MDLPVEQLREAYGWKKIETWHFFPSGHMNINTYIKADGKEYNVRFYKTRTQSEIEFEIEVLKKFTAEEFPCPLPLLATNGEEILNLNGAKVVCFTFILGETNQTQSIENVEKVAQKVAEFHLKGRKIKLERYRNGETLEEFKQFVAMSREEFTALQPYCAEIAPFVLKELSALQLPIDLEVGLVHNDIKPENIVFNDGKVVGFVDFDLSYVGDLLSDVASAALWWSTTQKGIKKENIVAFLHAYQELRPLTVAEKNSFTTALLFQALKQVWRYPYFVRLKPDVAKRNSEMFLRAAKQIKNYFSL